MEDAMTRTELDFLEAIRGLPITYSTDDVWRTFTGTGSFNVRHAYREMGKRAEHLAAEWITEDPTDRSLEEMVVRAVETGKKINNWEEIIIHEVACRKAIVRAHADDAKTSPVDWDKTPILIAETGRSADDAVEDPTSAWADLFSEPWIVADEPLVLGDMRTMDKRYKHRPKFKRSDVVEVIACGAGRANVYLVTGCIVRLKGERFGIVIKQTNARPEPRPRSMIHAEINDLVDTLGFTERIMFGLTNPLVEMHVRMGGAA